MSILGFWAILFAPTEMSALIAALFWCRMFDNTNDAKFLLKAEKALNTPAYRTAVAINYRRLRNKGLRARAQECRNMRRTGLSSMKTLIQQAGG
jgi:hypothetical protein